MTAKAAKYRVLVPVEYFPDGVKFDDSGKGKGMVKRGIGEIVNDLTPEDANGLMLARVIEEEPQPKVKGDEK